MTGVLRDCCKEKPELRWCSGKRGESCDLRQEKLPGQKEKEVLRL